MKIVSAATAFPRNYYSQEVLQAALQQYWNGRLENPQMLSRLHTRAGVDGRHLALPLLEYYNLNTWGENNRAWFQAAEELGSKALCRSASAIGIDREQIRALLFM